jgi:hypothetical protein
MRKKLLRFGLLFTLAATFTGCGTTKDVGAASDAVVTFHARLDSEDYSTIYTQADPILRNATSQKDFLDLVSAVHRKLGKVISANRQGFFVNFTTSGTRVRLNYSTKFTDGDAQEEFVWAKSGNDFTLVGYNINSNALITK